MRLPNNASHRELLECPAMLNQLALDVGQQLDWSKDNSRTPQLNASYRQHVALTPSSDNKSDWMMDQCLSLVDWCEQNLFSYKTKCMRLAFHRTEPGAVVPTHIDSWLFHTLCHRVHLPLTGTAIHISEGTEIEFRKGWFTELNNKVWHSVRSVDERTNLVLDFCSTSILEHLNLSDHDWKTNIAQEQRATVHMLKGAAYK